MKPVRKPVRKLTTGPEPTTAQVPNNSKVYKDYKRKQEEWANMQQLSGKPVTLVQLKPPKPQPKKQQAAPSHKITSFFLPR